MPRKPRYLSHNTNNQSLDNKTSTNLHSPWFPFTHPSEIQGQQHLCDNVLSGEASASASTSKPVNDPAPLKVPINSPYTLCVDDYFAQSKNPTRKRKKIMHKGLALAVMNLWHATKQCVLAGYNHVNVAPYPQPAQQHSSDSNTELHDSQEVVTHHVASQDLNPSTSCRSSTSNVSLQDEVFQNKRPKKTQQSDQYTNVAPDPQPPQQHATTSNTEVHESHQDVDDHFASQNLHPVSCSPSSFDNRLSQNKRQKRTQASSSTSTRRATGGATHNDLIHFFDTHNELVQVLRAARELSDQPNVPEFKLRLYNAEGTRGYELPTSNTLAAIVFDSGPTSEADFDVIIQYKGGQPQRINKLHKSYMSMQFPLIFIYGQPGFHTGLMSRPTAPNKKPRRVSLNAFYTYQLHPRPHTYDLLFRTAPLMLLLQVTCTKQNTKWHLSLIIHIYITPQ
ncbi:helitron helicase-like domain-containing protein [Artemisia annua]|uniref:Helitron helicase-like domain-containing protein n=1 Tax=Artemisia annua TaxID=35608 RepID=A0A2U1P4F4_ARTAN|nr:helitron helicase-like domain-containing protein [Artemisia annua]